MATTLVLDTNIVLDVFVFADGAAGPLQAALEDRSLHWLATPPMRMELERVLGYPQIASRLLGRRLAPQQILDGFDRHVRMVEVPAKARYTCKDADDQKFIDLAVAHRGLLLSKDAAVLSMKKRLATLQVDVSRELPASSYRLSGN